MDRDAKPDIRRIRADGQEISDSVGMIVTGDKASVMAEIMCTMESCAIMGMKPRCYLVEGEGRYSLCYLYVSKYAGDR